MKIRSQLNLLVVAVVAPIALLAGVMTAELWDLQRAAHGRLFLERVSALRLALDTELEGIQRSLRGLADVPNLDTEQGLPAFRDRFPRLLASNGSWSTIGLVRPDGAPLARLDKQPLPADAVLDRATREAVGRSRAPETSDLVTLGNGRAHLTYVALPVMREGELRAVFYVGIEHTSWLAFLEKYPVSEHATLTLNDRGGRVIARTLNNERWVGQQSTPVFWNRTAGKTEDQFLSRGLEGQQFYSAFSRSRAAGWVLGTGVPQSEVEAALRLPTAATVAGIIVASVLALAFALLLGRRIATELTSLADAARATGNTTGAAMPGRPLAIDEAETVRLALEESAALLRLREQSLHQALQSEALLRAGAERDSQAKDQFLAMLGHELRNPLSAMTTAAALLDMSAGKPEAAQRAREILQRQLRHLTGIVDDLLDVARLASGKVALNRKGVDLARAARNVVDAFVDAGRCRHVTLKTAYATAPVFADETRMEQVISNLLDNACKYTPAGGDIALEVRSEDGNAVLSVRDSGSGIGPELLPHVFEIFAQGARTMDRAQGGLGLGLTVVHRLVALHGGSVTADSAGLDQGSTVTVRLPLATGVPAPDTSRAAPALAPRRILLVEDNADNRDSIAAMLRMLGHEVDTVADGLAGCEALLAGKHEIALVDLGLPGLDGLEVARRVRASARGSDVLLIALTGYGSESDRSRAFDSGFDDFLIKPFDLARFEAAVNRAG